MFDFRLDVNKRRPIPLVTHRLYVIDIYFFRIQAPPTMMIVRAAR